MPTVLVVDDSSSDRHLAGNVLEEDARIHVIYATDGHEAISTMESAAVDVILTDLMMPKMDGLELVAAIRSRYPVVPIILMTSKGNEDIAVQALQEGAASYVPKSSVANDLLATVHDVLEVSGLERGHKDLLDSLSHNEFIFRLDNDASFISSLVGYLRDAVAAMNLCEDTDRIRIAIALEEALTNALHHGNLEIGSELRETDAEAYDGLVKQRKCESPYCHRKIEVHAKLSRTEAHFTIRDEGPGFDPTRLPDPTDPANLEKVSGRGVLLMRTFMDEVIFNEQGNQVTMIKRRLRNDE